MTRGTKMDRAEYFSSAKVMFSDRGSICFGFVVIALMIALSIALFMLKFQKKGLQPSFSNKNYQKQVSSLLFHKQRFVLKPTQTNFLFFSTHSKKAINKNFSLNTPIQQP